MIIINLTKAKEIKKDQIRQEREPLLAKLDLEVMKNITNPEALQEIEAKKQILRDATEHTSITNAKTIEKLKQADPLADIKDTI